MDKQEAQKEQDNDKSNKNQTDKIKEILSGARKIFKEEAIMTLRDVRAVNVDVVPTGSFSLDLALGVGGIPCGRIIEIYGPESSGKTTLALHIIAEKQKQGGVCAFIDAEHSLDPDYSKKLGVKVNELLISQPNSGEQALQIVEHLIRTKEIGVIVVDSVSALTPKVEIEGQVGDTQIGTQARLMSQALRKFSGIISRTKTILIFLNQTRMKIGVIFGNPETTSGGMALKFYASVRINLRQIAKIKDKDEIIGNRIKAKIVKNKVAAPFKVTEFDIYYNQGISYFADVLHTGIRNNIIKRAGAWYFYGEEKLGKGSNEAQKFLEDNSKILKKIEQEIKRIVDKE